jgi:hypothetical protein
MKHHLEIFTQELFAPGGPIFVKCVCGNIWLLSASVENAWAVRIPFDKLPENAVKLSLSTAVYSFLGIPLIPEQMS